MTTATTAPGQSRLQTINGIDFAVADLSLHEFGRKEIRLAEHEMPGLMDDPPQVCQDASPLARSPDRRLSPHDHPDRRAGRDPGQALGAQVRWASAAISISTQDHAAAAAVVGSRYARAAEGRPGVRQKRRDPARILVTTPSRILDWSSHENGDPVGPNLILDDGGDATLLDPPRLSTYEKTGVVPRSVNRRRPRQRGRVPDHPGLASIKAANWPRTKPSSARRGSAATIRRRQRRDHHRGPSSV